MAQYQDGIGLGGADDVQDLSVPRVQGSKEGPLQTQSHYWMFNFKAFLAHNRHLKDGEFRSGGCAFCTGGPEAVSVAVKTVVPSPRVDSSPGADEEGDPTSASGRDVPWSFGYEEPGT